MVVVVVWVCGWCGCVGVWVCGRVGGGMHRAKHGHYASRLRLTSSTAHYQLTPRQIGQHFTDGIFNCIILNENIWISITISMNFVPKAQINNIPALVHIMTWRRPGDKLLSEPLILSLLTHICVTRPQCVSLGSICCSSVNNFYAVFFY